jgi:hypothetical protein
MAKAKLFQMSNCATMSNCEIQKKLTSTTTSTTATNATTAGGMATRPNDENKAAEAIYDFVHPKSNTFIISNVNNPNDINMMNGNSVSAIVLNPNQQATGGGVMSNCSNRPNLAMGNNLDSGFDVDSSTCTATTTSKYIYLLKKQVNPSNRSFIFNFLFKLKPYERPIRMPITLALITTTQSTTI